MNDHAFVHVSPIRNKSILHADDRINEMDKTDRMNKTVKVNGISKIIQINGRCPDEE